MPENLDRCVQKVRAQGFPEDNAHAICQAAIAGADAGKHFVRAKVGDGELIVNVGNFHVSGVNRRLHDWKSRDNFWTPGIAFREVADIGADPPEKFQLFKFGDFNHPDEDDFVIDDAFANEIISTFKDYMLPKMGGIPIDEDHPLGEGRPGPAWGWITNLEIIRNQPNPDHNGIWATAKWTEPGEEAIRKGIYRFISPEYSPSYFSDGTDGHIGLTLVRTAVTNSPFFKGMAELGTEPIAANDRRGSRRIVCQEVVPVPADLETAKAIVAAAQTDEEFLAALMEVAPMYGQKMGPSEGDPAAGSPAMAEGDEGEGGGGDDVAALKAKIETLEAENAKLKAQLEGGEGEPAAASDSGDTKKMNDLVVSLNERLSNLETSNTKLVDRNSELELNDVIAQNAGLMMGKADIEDMKTIHRTDAKLFDRVMKTRSNVPGASKVFKTLGYSGDAPDATPSDAPKAADHDLNEAVIKHMADTKTSNYLVALRQVIRKDPSLRQNATEKFGDLKVKE